MKTPFKLKAGAIPIGMPVACNGRNGFLVV